MAQIGDSVGDYRLVDVLGSGTFGQVFLAEHRWLAPHQRAIKFLHFEHLDNTRERGEFLKEAKILNQLSHPAILQITGFHLDDKVSYIITNYASGGTLRTRLKERAGQPLDLAEALRIVVPIGEALQHAHNHGIVHSDLKPANILFDAQNRPLLADFGIAVELTTRSSDLGNGGTAPYMAPEQFDGRARRESDQYALGCLLYEMLSGQRPFDGSTWFALHKQHLNEPPVPPRLHNPRIPEHVNAAILKAMAKEHTQRHANVAAFLAALQAQPQSGHQARKHSPPKQPASPYQLLAREASPPNPFLAPPSRPSPASPLPSPASPRRKRKSGRRRLPLLLLLLLSLILVGVLLLNALGGPGGLVALGHLTATVQITPQSQIVQNDYLISAVTTTPDAIQRQVGARVLSAQSETLQATGNATGSLPARQATGILMFSSNTGNDITIGTTILTTNNGVQIQFNGPVVVPALSSTTVRAFAVQSGVQGNIPAKAIFGSCCFAGIVAQNPSAFTGGQDPQNNVIIQQSDIDGAARPLVSQLTQSTQTVLQQQVRSGERVVDGSFDCQPITSADHKAGDLAKTVMVSVSVKCSEEVFDLAAAQQMASGFLQTSPSNNVDLTGYKLVRSIVTTLISATVVSSQNQVSINIQAAGKWVFQFSDQLQQQIKQKLVKQSKTNVQRLLKQYMGIFSATINLSSGSTMPADVNDITLNIVSLAGLQPGTPTGVPTLPVSSPPDLGGARAGRSHLF